MKKKYAKAKTKGLGCGFYGVDPFFPFGVIPNQPFGYSPAGEVLPNNDPGEGAGAGAGAGTEGAGAGAGAGTEGAGAGAGAGGVAVVDASAYKPRAKKKRNV